MKKFIGICLILAMGLWLIGCAEQLQFDVSLRAGLFQGVADLDPEWTINAELSEMDIGQYVKVHENKIKDLSTIDTKFYKPYHIELVFSKGNENYVVKFAAAVAQNARTTDTYKLQNIDGDRFYRELNLSDVLLRPIDNDGDNVVDEFRIDYTLNGKADGADLKFVSEGEDGPVAHHNFQYDCSLSFDDNIMFDLKAEDRFSAGTQLFYYIYKVEGYKVVMYVNGEMYAEIDPSGENIMRFEYVTGYRDVSIEFRSVKLDAE